MQKMIPLKDLRFGEEHVPPLNVRKTGRDIGIGELAASIDANGMGQALNVVEQGSLGFVEDGNRRLRALRLLEKKGNLTSGALIKCEINEKEGLKTGELGLALNTQRLAMHPADFYEAVKDQRRQGRTEEEIVSRTGWSMKEVRQMLALGSLAPVILDDWRADKLGNNPIDVVRALTLAPNLKEQEAVYKRLKKAGDLWSRSIREAFGATDHQTAANLQFVGRAAYELAGGKIVEDLFQERHVVSDPKLLNELAEKKIGDKLTELKEAGWAWTAHERDVPGGWRYGWQKVPGGKKAKPEDKVKSGCVLEVKNDGTFEIVYGLIKPDNAKPLSQKTSSRPGEPEVPKGSEKLSNSLHNSLEQMNAKATKEALKIEPPASPLAGILAEIASSFIFADRPWAMSGAIAHKMSAIRNAISPAAMDAALVKAFNAERYFKGAPKAFVIKAIKEAVNPEQAKKLSAGTKAAAWKFALANVVKTGWLPPELRTHHYSGPGAGKPKLVKPKAAKVPRTAPAKKAA